jgi:hypothetical protein
MNTIFGDFLHDLPPSQEYLILSFSPGSIPLQQRWRNNCLSADFLADYLSTFFLNDDDDKESNNQKQMEIQSAVSYIANELLENAMKYSNKMSESPISIQIHLNLDLIIFQITNSIEPNNLTNFQNYIKKLLESDPDELYLDMLENNAINNTQENSGLGFLTMVNDYNAKLGWKFEMLSKKSTEMGVTTMVQLQI